MGFAANAAAMKPGPSTYRSPGLSHKSGKYIQMTPGKNTACIVPGFVAYMAGSRDVQSEFSKSKNKLNLVPNIWFVFPIKNLK